MHLHTKRLGWCTKATMMSLSHNAPRFFKLFQRDKDAYHYIFMPYVLTDGKSWYRVVHFISRERRTDVFCHVGKCLFDGSVFSIKVRELRLGTSSFLLSFPSLTCCASRKCDYSSSHRPLQCWGEMSKCQEPCGAKGMCACSLLVVYLCT